MTVEVKLQETFRRASAATAEAKDEAKAKANNKLHPLWLLQLNIYSIYYCVLTLAYCVFYSQHYVTYGDFNDHMSGKHAEFSWLAKQLSRYSCMNFQPTNQMIHRLRELIEPKLIRCFH